MDKLRDARLTEMLGVAPGPANGFTLDLILTSNVRSLLDWAMIILNPLEPWPGSLCLPPRRNTALKIITRVVDYGGLSTATSNRTHLCQIHHRSFRPAVGWKQARANWIQLRPIANAMS
jgi:hypothetical protein